MALYLAKGLSEGPPARITACTLRLMSSVVILSIFLSVGDLLSFGRCGPGLLVIVGVKTCSLVDTMELLVVIQGLFAVLQGKTFELADHSFTRSCRRLLIAEYRTLPSHHSQNPPFNLLLGSIEGGRDLYEREGE